MCTHIALNGSLKSEKKNNKIQVEKRKRKKKQIEKETYVETKEKKK